MMFGSVAPDIRKSDALALARYMVGLCNPKGDPEALRDVVVDGGYLMRKRPLAVDYRLSAWSRLC